MIGVVFKKEMLSHLLSQRFAACTILAVVLIIANGVLTRLATSHSEPLRRPNHTKSLIIRS